MPCFPHKLAAKVGSWPLSLALQWVYQGLIASLLSGLRGGESEPFNKFAIKFTTAWVISLCGLITVRDVFTLNVVI